MNTGNNKKFVVKNGLISQNTEYLSPDAQQKITVSMRDTGELSFDGDSSQLFSVNESLEGVIFSVNNSTEIPSIEIDDDGTIRFAEFGGNILLGTNSDNSTDILQVNGSVDITSSLTANTLIGDGSGITSVNALTLSGDSADELRNSSTHFYDNTSSGLIATDTKSAIDELNINKVDQTSDTGSVEIPTGTELERDSSPQGGYFRFNTDTLQFEGYNGSVWGSVGGAGATGGGNDQVFIENDQVVTTSYEIGAGKNAFTTGPVEIDSGVVVTVPDGSRWVIL